jgi:hypothetical protein
MKTWNEPKATEIKMDAEISSYQDDTFDPMRDGPHFATNETDHERPLPRA